MGIAKELNQLCYNLTGDYSEHTTARGVLNDLISKLSGTETGAERLGQALGTLSKDVGGVVWDASVFNNASPSNNEAASITSVQVPDGVTKITSGGFYAFKGMTTISATESVKEISGSAFSGLTQLSSVSFPGVEKIAGGAFGGCSNFQASTAEAFPKLKILTEGALNGCSRYDRGSGSGEMHREGITDFSLPALEYIGNAVTGQGAGYRTINCPKLIEIGDGNFCGAMYAVTLEDEDGNRNDLSLPSCEKIGGQNFNNFKCGKIILPKLREIGVDNFKSTEFSAFILSDPTKVCKLGDNCFQNMTQDDTHGWFYVPKHLLNQYKKEWSDLAERFRAIEDYPEIME